MPPVGAFNGVREATSQYRPIYRILSNRDIEYESTAQVAPARVRGTRCNANTSTGDSSVSPFCWTISRTAGQRTASGDGMKTCGSAVAMASLVLLSRITSKGARKVRLATSVQERRSVRIHCIAREGCWSFSASWPRRTASAEKSTFWAEKRGHVTYDQQDHPFSYPSAPSQPYILVEGRRGAHDNAIA